MPHLLAVLAVFLLATVSFASDSADEPVGLASEPIPIINRNRHLTDSDVSIVAAGFRDLPASSLIESLGAPMLVDLGGNGDVQFHYEFDLPLIVSVRNGRVSSVSTVVVINREEQERQTGIRDDDFVGLVGP